MIFTSFVGSTCIKVKFILMPFPAQTNRQELYVDDVQMRSTPVTSWSARSSLTSNSYSLFTFSIKGETTEYSVYFQIA